MKFYKNIKEYCMKSNKKFQSHTCDWLA